MGTIRARKPPRGAKATRKFNGKVYRWDGTWTADRSAAMATADTRREGGKRARVVKSKREGITDYHLYVRGRFRAKPAKAKRRKAAKKKPRKRRRWL